MAPHQTVRGEISTELEFIFGSILSKYALRQDNYGSGSEVLIDHHQGEDAKAKVGLTNQAKKNSYQYSRAAQKNP